MIVWHDGALTNPRPAPAEVVRQAERKLRVRFPQDFLTVAGAHQGASPEPWRLHLLDFVTSVDCLLHFEDEPAGSNILVAHSLVEDVLPKGVIPFALATNGDLFCFDHRESDDVPSVVYWSVDTGTVPVASSFAALLAKLHD